MPGIFVTLVVSLYAEVSQVRAQREGALVIFSYILTFFLCESIKGTSAEEMFVYNSFKCRHSLLISLKRKIALVAIEKRFLSMLGRRGCV